MKVLPYSLVALFCSFAVPAVAHGETLVSPTGSAIPIVDSNTAGLGSLTVDGADGDILDLDVNVNLSHEDPFDVDLALVSPDGEAQILMSDACSSINLTNYALTFDQDASTSLPNGACTGSALQAKATNVGASPEIWSAPGAPQNLTEADLDGYDGENPNGTWRLFVADDAGGGAGAINSWSLRIETEDSEIVMPGDAADGLSRPYPSAKSFDLEGRAITDLNLKIDGFHHPRPDDVDVLLQSPSGQAVMVFSDACGDGFRFHANWLFDDEANFGLNDNGGADCNAVQQKPSIFGEVESLPPPAPPGPYATSLSAFDDLGGVDNWRLYVNDDTTREVSGYITFWEIVATTRPAAATGFASTAVATAEGQTAQLTVTRAAPATGPATLDVSINPSDITPADIGPVPTQLQFARGETSKTIEIPIPADPEGEVAETFIVGLGNALDDAALADATAFATVTIAASVPDNRFTIGKPKKLPNGFARLPVTIPYPGTITADDAGAKNKLNQTELDLQGGTANLTIKPAKDTKRKLRAGKKIKLTAEITYTPYGGSPNDAETKVTLKKT